MMVAALVVVVGIAGGIDTEASGVGGPGHGLGLSVAVSGVVDDGGAGGGRCSFWRLSVRPKN